MAEAAKTKGLEKALSALKRAADAELIRWIAEPISVANIVKARQATAKAAATYMAIAASLDEKVNDNIMAVAGTGALAEVNNAVSVVFLATEGMDRASFVTYVMEMLSFDHFSAEAAQTPTEAPELLESIGEFYTDISDILSGIGDGLAGAQKEMDIGAIRSQRMIMDDDLLSGHGLTATWYVIPEAEFTMKMELAVSAEEKMEGTADVKTSSTRVTAALSSAKYSALYSSDGTEESTLRVRFVPVPMPAVVKIPNVVGLSPASAVAALSGASVNSVFIGEDGEAWTDSSGKVATQSIAGGEVMLAEKTLVVTVKGEKTAAQPEEEEIMPPKDTPATTLKEENGEELHG